MLYDRPVRELMRDAAKQLPSPTTPNEIIGWFAREYPLVKKTTVAAHITGLTANDRNRRHYSVSRYEPIFVRVRTDPLVFMTLTAISRTKKPALMRARLTTPVRPRTHFQSPRRPPNSFWRLTLKSSFSAIGTRSTGAAH
jgi:hypothetical protein